MRFLFLCVALGVLGCGADGTGRGKADAANGAGGKDANTADGEFIVNTKTVCLDKSQPWTCVDAPAGSFWDPNHCVLYETNGNNTSCAWVDITHYVFACQPDARGEWPAPLIWPDRCKRGECVLKSDTHSVGFYACNEDGDCTAPPFPECTPENPKWDPGYPACGIYECAIP